MTLDEQLRQSYNEQGEKDSKSSGGDSRLFLPKGSCKVRILPPKDIQKDYIYHTHNYHYMKTGSSGKYVWTLPTYNVDGVDMPDPIHEAANMLYKKFETTKNDAFRKAYSAIKRKRHYYFNVLLLDEDIPDDQRLRILVDNTNNGELARRICAIMGIPFYYDWETKYADKTTVKRDADLEYKSLVDIETGCDLKIIRKSSPLTLDSGAVIQKVNYSESQALKPRKLTDAELELVENSYDLRNAVKYESYSSVKSYLDAFKNEGSEDDEESVETESEETKVKTEVKEAPKVAPKNVSTETVDGDELDGLMDEFED